MRRRRASGNMVLETALFIPVLLLLIVGTVQIGKVTYTYYTLKKIVYAAARELALTHAGALAGEDRAQGSRHSPEVHASFDRFAVADAPLHVDVPVELTERLGREGGPREHALAARDEHRGRGLILTDARDRRDVAENAEVLGQRVFDEPPHYRSRRVERGHDRARPTATGGSATNTGAALPRTTKRPASASAVFGKSERVCAPRDSSRACAAATIVRDTRNRLITS